MTSGPRPRAFRLPGGEPPRPEPRRASDAAPDATSGAFPFAQPFAQPFTEPSSEPPPRAGLPDGVRIVEEPFEIVEAADGTPVPVAARRRSPWGTLFLSATGGLVSIAVGLSVERLIADLFQAAPWLGWVALALLGLALLALAAIVARELVGLARERRIERLRQTAIDALQARDHTAALGVVAALSAFYADRTAMAGARQRLAATSEAILDVDDRLGLAERELLAPLDRQARNAIATAAKQVSAVTALSPRAIVDVAFVVFAAVRLLRRIAAIYGGRPGFLGFLRLARAAFAHLTVTGGMAVGESVLQQVLGLGVAARISAKLGEGVLNGLMTARFGLAALAVCRPLPFVREAPPQIADVAGELFRAAEPEAGATR